MSKRMKIILIAVAFVTAFVIIFQAITIHNIKEKQEEQFSEHIAAAAQGFEDYRDKGNAFWYEGAVRELASAYSIASLLQESDDYKSVHSVLFSLVEEYRRCPNDPFLYSGDLEPFIDEIIVALKDFSTHQDVGDLYTKLRSIDLEILAMRGEQAEKAGINF